MALNGLYCRYLSLSEMERFLRLKVTSPEDAITTLDEHHNQIASAIQETGKRIYNRFSSIDRLYCAGKVKRHSSPDL